MTKSILIILALMLCSCASTRGYSDEEAQRVDAVGVYGDEQAMREKTQSFAKESDCQFLGVMEGTSGFGFYSEAKKLSGNKGTYNDALLRARIAALRNGANAIVIKQSFPSKAGFESINDYVYTLITHGYRCEG